MPYLVKFNSNCNDEFDAEGFCLFYCDKSLQDWKEGVEYEFDETIGSRSLYVSTNDFIYVNKKEYFDALDITYISKVEYGILKSRLGNRYGMFLD